MGNVFIALFVSFGIAFYAIPVIIRVAKAKNLYDVPDERKIHSNLIPSLGGVGIFVGFILSYLIFSNNTTSALNLSSYISSFLIIFFVGVKDDILSISPLKKIVGQALVAGIIIFKMQLIIDNMFGFLGIHELHEGVSFFLTAVTIIVTQNAFNLIDGVDGLAGGLSIICSLFFGIFFFTEENYNLSLLAFSFVGSSVAFLIYNFSESKKIFMGDTGSLLSGTVNVILAIHFITSAHTSQSVFSFTASPAVAFGVLMIPLLDTLRVFGLRIFKGKSPFSADRNHLHHILLDKGCSHIQTTCILVASSVVCSIGSYLLQFLGTTELIILQIALFFIAVSALTLIKFGQSKKALIANGQHPQVATEVRATSNTKTFFSTEESGFVQKN